jgi:hypothetical protein
MCKASTDLAEKSLIALETNLEQVGKMHALSFSCMGKLKLYYLHGYVQSIKNMLALTSSDMEEMAPLLKDLVYYYLYSMYKADGSPKDIVDQLPLSHAKERKILNWQIEGVERIRKTKDSFYHSLVKQLASLSLNELREEDVNPTLDLLFYELTALNSFSLATMSKLLESNKVSWFDVLQILLNWS